MFLEYWPGLHVTVLVDGEQSAEYDDEDAFPSNKEKSKYIEAVADAKFQIKFSALRSLAVSPEDCVCFRVYLDGKLINGLVYKLKDGGGTAYEYTMKGKDLNTPTGSYVEPYQFASLQTNDGPVGKAKIEDFKNLGEIMLTCSWCRKRGAEYVAPNGGQHEVAVGASVPEKCLKGRAISNRATTGAREARTAPCMAVALDYPYGNEAFATFKFKYRSRRDLQVEGVITRSPSPIPLEERDPDDLSPEEARELVRRLRQQQEQIEIKKEGKKSEHALPLGADSDIEEVSITGEGSARKRKPPSTDSGIEIVDLTDD